MEVAPPLWYRLARRAWHGLAGRSVRRRRRIWDLASTLKRSSVVRERLRFVVRDLRAGGTLARYTLAASGTAVCLRHAGCDLWAYDELLVNGEYEVPAEVDAILGRVGRPLRIVDLGAHVGFFGAWAAAHWDVARMVSYEPNPDPLAILRTQSRAHSTISWDVVGAAAWNADGRLALSTHTGHLCPGPEEEAVISVPTQNVFSHLMEADLIKMDIEGAEWTLLEDPRFAGVGARVVVLEAHDRLCPDPANRALLAARGLERAGLQVVQVRRKPSSRTELLWAIRPSVGERTRRAADTATRTAPLAVGPRVGGRG